MSFIWFMVGFVFNIDFCLCVIVFLGVGVVSFFKVGCMVFGVVCVLVFVWFCLMKVVIWW